MKFKLIALLFVAALFAVAVACKPSKDDASRHMVTTEQGK